MRVRPDRSALNPWMAVAAVVVVVLVVAVVYVYGYADDLGKRATSKDIAIIEGTGSVKILVAFDSYSGTADLSVSVNYDVPTGTSWRWPQFSLFNPSHSLKCEMRCTGPGDYIQTTHQTKRFNGFVNYEDIKFDLMRFPVEKPGSYTVTFKVSLDGKDIGSSSKTVTVNG